MLDLADLEQLDEVTLKKLLKKKRLARVAAEVIPPLPPYTPSDDPADKLSFEYGLELAFRPDGDPDLIPSSVLVPLLFTKPAASLKRSRSTLVCSPLMSMFSEAAIQFAGHIGATPGSTRVHSCGIEEIEFPSPIMTKMSQIEWYYARIKALADGIKAKVELGDTTSGGGHIHVTQCNREWSRTQIFTVVMAVCDSPWLGWVFNDPEDSRTAISPIGDVMSAMWNYTSDGDSPTCGWWDWDPLRILLSTAVRPNLQGRRTLEFRLFGAPHDWEEQRLHVLFLDRWLKDVLAHPRRLPGTNFLPMKYSSPLDLHNITFAQSTREFNKLLTRLDLRQADYQRFVDRNLKARYDNGWTRN